MNWKAWTALVLPFLLVACGGGGGSADSPKPPDPTRNPSGTTALKVGGFVGGVHGSGLVLQIGQGETLAIEKDGDFAFPTRLAPGTSYEVKVLSTPRKPTEHCDVMHGTGTVSMYDITGIYVQCYITPLYVQGTVSGLRGMGAQLSLGAASDGQPLAPHGTAYLSKDGSFAFEQSLSEGMVYEATVVAQPSWPTQTCVIANSSGTIDPDHAASLTVTCTTAAFKLGGKVTGLKGQGLVIRNNGGDDLAIAADGAFTFATPVENGSSFDVSVATQPSSVQQACVVAANGSGTMPTVDLSPVEVRCHGTLQLGTAGDDEAHAASLDSSLNLWVAGTTTGSFGGPNAGGIDGFVMKLDWNGMLLWKRQFGSTGDENVSAISFGAGGDVYVVGSTTGNVDGNTNAGNEDILIAKYDKNGNKLWTRSFGTAGTDAARDLRVSGSGALFLVGYTTGSLDGATTPGGSDLFVAKLDADGNVLWVRQMGTPADDAAYGITFDATNTLYVAGSTSGDLDGHANTSGGEVGFLLNYDDQGNLLNSKLFCQVNCFGPMTYFRSRFNSVTWSPGIGPIVAGRGLGDPAGEFPNQIGLFSGIYAGGWSLGGHASIGGTREFQQIVLGKADGALYITGNDTDLATGRKRSFLMQMIPDFYMRYEVTGEPTSGDEVAFAVASDPLSNAWTVGYATAGVDGNASLGGRDIFIRRFNINGDLQ